MDFLPHVLYWGWTVSYTHLNFDAKVNNTAVFAKGDGGSYNVEIKAAGFNDVTGTVTQDSGEYKYVYAGLTWEQYWASEGVYEATNTSSSENKDRRGESDMGGFDAVTRATANHGLHREMCIRDRFCPITIPLYTFSPGPTKSVPRS